MKQFFVIKDDVGHTWFDQYGYEMRKLPNGTPDYRNAFFTSEEMQIQEVDTSAVDDKEQVDVIRFGFFVLSCKDKDEVKYLANLQNNR